MYLWFVIYLIVRILHTVIVIWGISWNVRTEHEHGNIVIIVLNENGTLRNCLFLKYLVKSSSEGAHKQEVQKCISRFIPGSEIFPSVLKKNQNIFCQKSYQIQETLETNSRSKYIFRNSNELKMLNYFWKYLQSSFRHVYLFPNRNIVSKSYFRIHMPTSIRLFWKKQLSYFTMTSARNAKTLHYIMISNIVFKLGVAITFLLKTSLVNGYMTTVPYSREAKQNTVYRNCQVSSFAQKKTSTSFRETRLVFKSDCVPQENSQRFEINISDDIFDCFQSCKLFKHDEKENTHIDESEFQMRITQRGQQCCSECGGSFEGLSRPTCRHVTQQKSGRNINGQPQCNINITVDWGGTIDQRFEEYDSQVAIRYMCQCDNGASSTRFYLTGYDMFTCFFNKLKLRNGEDCIPHSNSVSTEEPFDQKGNEYCE